MDAHEVVPEEEEGEVVDVVLELLRVGVGAAGVALHVHAHGQVLALHVAV